MLTGTVGNYTLSFTAPSVTGVTTGPIAVAAGVPAAVEYLVQPSTVVAGASIAPAVQVRVVDGAGNTVTTAINTVTLALGANPGGSTLGGTTSLAAVAGVATFGSLTLNHSAAGYTLTAASTGLTGATSTVFTVNPGAASALAITTAPTTGQSGVVLSPQPVIRLVDANGNTVPTSGTLITAALASGSGTLGGTLTASTVNGVATFAGLVLTGTVGNYTLNFTSGALTGVTTGAIAVSAGVPAVARVRATAQHVDCRHQHHSDRPGPGTRWRGQPGHDRHDLHHAHHRNKPRWRRPQRDHDAARVGRHRHVPGALDQPDRYRLLPAGERRWSDPGHELRLRHHPGRGERARVHRSAERPWWRV